MATSRSLRIKIHVDFLGYICRYFALKNGIFRNEERVVIVVTDMKVRIDIQEIECTLRNDNYRAPRNKSII